MQNYNVKDWNQDGFVNEADAALHVSPGPRRRLGPLSDRPAANTTNCCAIPNYTWVPRAEPISVAGAPVVVDYYDERRFAIDAAANKAKMGAEIVDLTYRKHYADPESQPYVDTHVDASDGQLPGLGRGRLGRARRPGRLLRLGRGQRHPARRRMTASGRAQDRPHHRARRSARSPTQFDRHPRAAGRGRQRA